MLIVSYFTVALYRALVIPFLVNQIVLLLKFGLGNEIWGMQFLK